LLPLATELEGHPDNAAACLAGGATLSWREDGVARARAVEVHPELVAVALVAAEPMATVEARRLLPELVPFAAAARTAGRAPRLPDAHPRGRPRRRPRPAGLSARAACAPGEGMRTLDSSDAAVCRVQDRSRPAPDASEPPGACPVNKVTSPQGEEFVLADESV